MPGTTSCQSCGSAVSATDRFCPACGAEVAATREAVPETVVTPPSNQATCLSCGSALADAVNFCPHCGASRGEEDATVPSQGSLERITTERLTTATAGEFEILERLGYGAMGSVYLARDVALSRRVAIKVISPHLLEDDTIIARFRLEAQTVAALRHPHIVNLYGVRQFGDLHYFIMDFIDGPSLRSMMKAHAPLGIPVAQALLFQIGSALHYAHHRGRGVIHRDIKPANIMVDREGHAVVMDFGISRVGEGRSGLTQTGATIGTPEYMSPEQCMDQELTGASDQYALGIVAYEMLTGTVPFKGSTYAIMMAHASSPPPPIRERRPDCPPEIEAAVMRMLAKSPAERFSDLEAAVTALGGRPLGPRDPIRAAIIELAESVSSDLVALDDSSPLSPVPGSQSKPTVAITGLPDIVEPGDRFALGVESRRGTGPARPATDVVWASSDPEVAAIEGGEVVAIKPGSVSLTATVGEVASTVILSVRERRSADVRIRPQAVSIEAGGTIRLEVDVLDRKAEPLNRPVVWSSDDPQIALVAQDGTVTAVAPGMATIVANADGAQGTAEIEVQEAAVHEIQILDPPASVRVGQRLSLQARVTDATGATLRGAVVWHSEHPKVVAIKDGAPVAVATGTATLRAERGGRSTTVTIGVEPAEVEEIVISGLPDRVGVGDRIPLQAVVLDGARKPLIRPVAWRSGDERIARVSAAGEVEALGRGTVAISAESDGVTGAIEMAVGPSTAAAATVVVPAAAAAAGATAVSGAATGPGAAQPSAPKPARRGVGLAVVGIVLIGAAIAIAQVSRGGGEVEPAGPGVTDPAAAVDADAGAGQSTPPATVADADTDEPGRTDPPAAGSATPPQPQPQEEPPREPAVDPNAVASLAIEGGDRTFEPGVSQTLPVVARNAAGARVAAADVRWRSSNPGVATVRNGTVTAVAPGRARIGAAVAGVETSIGVTVEAPQPRQQPEVQPPTRDDVLREIQGFVDAIRRGDRETVQGLLGGAGRSRGGDLMQRMRETNFSARLARVGDPQPRPGGISIPFEVALSWRNQRGAQMNRPVGFIGTLRPDGNDWRLAAVEPRANR